MAMWQTQCILYKMHKICFLLYGQTSFLDWNNDDVLTHFIRDLSSIRHEFLYIKELTLVGIGRD